MNKHIEEYLDFYLTLEAPKYAVLIDGKWGSGKTYFIKNYFDNRKDHKYIYVSLNGVSSIKGIEDQFFEQLHPFLSSRTARITGKVLKGLLRASLKIDLNNDGKDDGSTSIQLPDIKLSEELNKAGERVLVFDDLERAKLSMKEILGYINQFVEHEGQRVLLIGSEENVKEKDKIESIKEKVIGRSFSVKPSYYDAYNFFLSELNSDEIKELLKNYKEDVKTIFKESNCQNLRLLRYGIIEFQRFFLPIKGLYLEAVNKELFISDLIKVFFMFTFEIGVGKIKKDDFERFQSVMIGTAATNLVSNEDYYQIRAKYKSLDFRRVIFSYKFWNQVFNEGTLKIDEFEKVKKNPKYFKEEKPLWYKLWNIYELKEAELEELLSEVEEGKKNYGFSSIEEIIHITGTLIELHDLKIYPIKEGQIINEFLIQVEKYVDENKTEFLQSTLEIRDGLLGCQVRSYNKKQFKNFIDKVGEIVNKGVLKASREKILRLFDLLDSDFETYEKEVISYELLGNSNLPFFSIWDLDKMIDILKRKSPKERRDIIFSIKNIISEVHIVQNDVIWLKSLVNRISKEFKFKGKSIENFSMSNSVKFLEEALEKRRK